MLLATWRFCDEQRELYEPHEQGEQQKCISKCITSGVMHSRQAEPHGSFPPATGSPPRNSPRDRQPPPMKTLTRLSPRLTFNRVPYKEFELFSLKGDVSGDELAQRPIGGRSALRVPWHLALSATYAPAPDETLGSDDHRVFRARDCSVDLNKRGIRLAIVNDPR